MLAHRPPQAQKFKHRPRLAFNICRLYDYTATTRTGTFCVDVHNAAARLRFLFLLRNSRPRDIGHSYNSIGRFCNSASLYIGLSFYSSHDILRELQCICAVIMIHTQGAHHKDDRILNLLYPTIRYNYKLYRPIPYIVHATQLPAAFSALLFGAFEVNAYVQFGISSFLAASRRQSGRLQCGPFVGRVASYWSSNVHNVRVYANSARLGRVIC
jgi:hypothetical protein